MVLFSTIVLASMLRKETDDKKRRIILQIINNIVNDKSKHSFF